MKKLILFIIHCISTVLWAISIFSLILIFVIEWKDVDVDNDSLKVLYKIWKN
jgi:hypothetical protein